MAETWYAVAQAASSDGLNHAVPAVEELPAGTLGRVVIEGLPWELARVFDLAGMEQLAGQWLVPAHCTVIDVYEQDGVGYIDFQVQGSPLLPILAAIAAILIAVGVIAAIITVWVKGPEAIEPVTDIFGLVFVMMLVGLMTQVTGSLDMGRPSRKALKQASRQ